MAGASVERATESRAVDDLLVRAEHGPAGLVVEGEAGIGKTTLVLEAVGVAERRGFRVLSAGGSPAEVSYAYAALADLLRDVEEATLAGLPRVQRVAIERARFGESTSGEPASDEHCVATAFVSVLQRVSADAPVLLVIDDAQWLDSSSRAVIGYAARRFTGRTGLLVTLRAAEPMPADSVEWPRLSIPDGLRRIRMSPLSLGEVHAVVSQRLGRTLPRPVITRLHEMCGGNPFFALELAHNIAASADADAAGCADDLPPSLAELVGQRIGSHDAPTAAALLAAACAAAPTVELISRATQTTVDEVIDVLEPVVADGVVVIDGHRVRFTHPLYATGVYSKSSRGHRRAMHRALAPIVDGAENRARHLALAATTADPSARAALDEAAGVVVSQGAPAVAAELVELAITLDGDTAQRRIQAAELHFRAGSVLPARRHLQTAIDRLPAGEHRCLALMLLGAVLAYDDDLGSAVQTMTQAVRDAQDDTALRAHCLLRLALATFMVGRGEEAIAYANDAVLQADRLDVPDLRSRARAIWVAIRFVRGFGVDRDALRTALQLEDRGGGATTWYRASAVDAMICAWTGDLMEARARMSAVRRHMLDGGTELDIIWAANHLATIDVWLGRYADAAVSVREAVERAEQMNGRNVLVTAWGWQAAVAAYTGDHAVARAQSGAAMAAAQATGAPHLVSAPTATLAFLEVSLGDYAAAFTALEPLLAAFDPAHDVEIVTGGWLPDAVETLCALGRVEAAAPLVDALEGNGVRHDRPWMLAMGARGRAQICAARGDLDTAQRLAERALSHHQRLPMPFETARTQLLLSQLQRRRRRKKDAAATLAVALDTFDRLGTPLWARRARAERTRLNGARGDGQAMTATERRIAQLAATGLSNKQIAAELFVAVKTVEMNLSRVYRKLGIRSRAGLSGALALHEDKGIP